MADALYIFTNDLRVNDNPQLQSLLEQHQNGDVTLQCAYVFDPQILKPTNFNSRSIGPFRLLFLLQSLQNLASSIIKQGVKFHFVVDTPTEGIMNLALQISEGEKPAPLKIHTQRAIGTYEQNTNQSIGKRLARLNEGRHPSNEITFEIHQGFTLFNSKDLPFAVSDLPNSFSKFRRKVEQLDLDSLFFLKSQAVLPVLNKSEIQKRRKPETQSLNKYFQQQFNLFITRPDVEQMFIDNGRHAEELKRTMVFEGGESAGLAHLQEYFESSAPQSYKQTRNALDDWPSSTKFSAWLANGCVSARRIWTEVCLYEQQHGANESTYWIKFELLWREYFQWQALAIKSKLFKFGGIKEQGPLTSFYPQRFAKWCQGHTPYPIVNAAMKQLNATGYMSNRARQIVASCLIHELQLDWRYGAAYFEQQLTDYDVAANWGNWQYLAGVGFDPRGSRRFNLDKQTATYDPNGEFINKWNGQDQKANQKTLDNVDIVDWPVS